MQVDTSKFRVLAADIGTAASIPNWPTQDLNGLIDALQRWKLCSRTLAQEDPGHPHSAYKRPYRGLCWGHCRVEPMEGTHLRRYVGTQPIYPDHPEAVRYFGNFVGYSFGFSLDTDDKALIELLDRLIEENLQRDAIV